MNRALFGFLHDAFLKMCPDVELERLRLQVPDIHIVAKSGSDVGS